MSEVKETMEDFASELEASYKEYDARRRTRKARTQRSGQSLLSRWKTRLY